MRRFRVRTHGWPMADDVHPSRTRPCIHECVPWGQPCCSSWALAVKNYKAARSSVWLNANTFPSLSSITCYRIYSITLWLIRNRNKPIVYPRTHFPVPFHNSGRIMYSTMLGSAFNVVTFSLLRVLIHLCMMLFRSHPYSVPAKSKANGRMYLPPS